MSTQAEPKTAPSTPDVMLELKNGKWKVTKSQENVHKKPGNTFVIGAPTTLPPTNWSVWFDPSQPPHEPDAKTNQVVFNISTGVAYEKTTDNNRKTNYKYTIRADGQIIDPKIIIDPPTP